THAGCTALADLPRNKTDEHLRKLADKGGVFGVYLMPFLRTAGQPMAEDVIQHIEHAINICGEDHVGVGTDGVISAIKKEDVPAQMRPHRYTFCFHRASIQLMKGSRKVCTRFRSENYPPQTSRKSRSKFPPIIFSICLSEWPRLESR
ncbi:MAG: peptidase, partial [Spartobacteria bacterium]|nr:peptidase [Spartobacteria bacterium]